MLNRRWLLIAAAVIAIILIRLFFLDYYEVPSNSMLPTIKPNDFILIEKTHFFSKSSFLNCFSTKIKKGDIYVFYKPSKNSRDNQGPEYVKRCFGMPGEIVKIKKGLLNEGYKSHVKNTFNLRIFPHDSAYKWSINDYGPILVPMQGMTININFKNFALYKDILKSEGVNLKIIMNKIRSCAGEKYSFKNNYYFMLGDNFYDSEDSRFFGLVPENNLIGRVIYVL